MGFIKHFTNIIQGMDEVIPNDGDETILVITKDDINDLPTWVVILIIIGMSNLE